MAARGASILLHNARVLTMDPDAPTARAVVVREGVIEHVGSDETAHTMARGVDERLDAQGGTLLPGFNDAHGHFIHEGLMADRLDLSTASGLDDVYRRIGEHARAHPEKAVIIAERWDDGRWPNGGYPTRAGLDAACADRPVLARRVDGHLAVANSALLAVYDERWEGPDEGIDRETGVLLERPSLDFNLVMPPTPGELDAAVARFLEKAAREGVTSGQDFANPAYFEAWERHTRECARRGESPSMRVEASTYLEHLEEVSAAGFETGMGGSWLRFGGVKVFADGSVGGRTAYLRAPYDDDSENRGLALFSDEELAAHVQRAHEARVQVRMHVIGDGAAEQGTLAFEALAEAVGVEEVRAARHRFEHYEMSDAGQRARAKRLGIVLSMQPNFVGAWSAADGLYARRLGARHRAMNPIAEILREGLPVAFGSDCMPFSPLAGLRGLMGAPYAEMRPPLVDALAAYTRGSAYGEHQENEKGVLRAGMLGDLVLLSGRLGELDDAAALANVDVALTVTAGHVVHRAA